MSPPDSLFTSLLVLFAGCRDDLALVRGAAVTADIVDEFYYLSPAARMVEVEVPPPPRCVVVRPWDTPAPLDLCVEVSKSSWPEKVVSYLRFYAPP